MVINRDGNHLFRLFLSDHILVELRLDRVGSRDLAELEQLFFYFFLLFLSLMALSHEGAEVDLTYRNSEDIPKWNSFCLFTVFLEIIAIPGLVSIHDGLLIVFIRFCIYTVCFIQIILRILFFRLSDHTSISRNRSVPAFCAHFSGFRNPNRFFRSAHSVFLARSSSGVLGLLRSISASHRIQIHIFQHFRRDPGHLCPVHTASHHHVKRSLHAVPAHVQSARQCDHLSRLVLRPSAHAADFFISVISVVFQSISPDLSIVANIPYFCSHHIRSYFCKMRSKATESFFFLNFSELP